MLDPYYRLTLKELGQTGVYSSGRFVLPDVYGVFTFRVQYQRPGLTFLEDAKKVVLLPFRHDEYERFIPAAYPYYANVFSTMAGVFLFSMIIFYGRDVDLTPRKTTKRD